MALINNFFSLCCCSNQHFLSNPHWRNMQLAACLQHEIEILNYFSISLIFPSLVLQCYSSTSWNVSNKFPATNMNICFQMKRILVDMNPFTNLPDPDSDPQAASSLRAPSQTQTDCFSASCLVSAASSSSFPSPQWWMRFEGPVAQCNENYGGEWPPWTRRPLGWPRLLHLFVISEEQSSQSRAEKSVLHHICQFVVVK